MFSVVSALLGYRKPLRLDAVQEDQIVAVEFDGVYDRSQVWINGHFVGGRPYGYSSFECVLTPLLKFGSEDNVLAVRVDHSRFADSRWYTGSGIYRHVRLRLTNKLHIGHWGTYVTTPEVTPEAATVRVETTIVNGSGQDQSFSLRSELFAPDGRAVASSTTSGSITDGTNQTMVQQIRFTGPQLWSPATPVLYTIKSRVRVADTVVDEMATPFGIRTLRFDPDQGFFLNEVATKFKGVCLHHDAGSLAEVYKLRQRILEGVI